MESCESYQDSLLGLPSCIDSLRNGWKAIDNRIEQDKKKTQMKLLLSIKKPKCRSKLYIWKQFII